MTIEEFDNIRSFLPQDTEIIVKITTPPTRSDIPEQPNGWSAMQPEDSSIGRFRMVCSVCGLTSNEYLSSQREKVIARYSYKPCPNCGAIFQKTNFLKEYMHE